MCMKSQGHEPHWLRDFLGSLVVHEFGLHPFPAIGFSHWKIFAFQNHINKLLAANMANLYDLQIVVPSLTFRSKRAGKANAAGVYLCSHYCQLLLENYYLLWGLWLQCVLFLASFSSCPPSICQWSQLLAAVSNIWHLGF